MEENWTWKESYRAQAHPHHAGGNRIYQRSPIIRVSSTVWVKAEAEASYNRVCKIRIVQDSGPILVHEVDKNLSSGKNKENTSMFVWGMLLGDDGARSGCYLVGLIPLPKLTDGAQH